MDEKLVDWVHNTADGDISELDFVPHFETWNEINSDSDDCLRNKCPSFADCFYFEAKKRAERADILIVNHALLLADAASDGNILPKYDLLIVDEAHHLPEVATDSFSLSISNRGVRALVGKAVKRVSAPSNMVHDVEFESQEFFQSIANDTTAAKTRIRSGIEGATHLSLALGRLKKWLNLRRNH
jgi:ATP-dependent DNA helicase DinG